MTPAWFTNVLQRYPRIAIVGGPRTGKTTLASHVKDRPVMGTDDYQNMPWEAIPGAMIQKVRTLGDSYAVEGVMTARALRKGMKVDAIVVMTEPKVAQLPGQAAMQKGVMSILAEVIASNSANVPVIMEPR